jgi:hypothetical protein
VATRETERRLKKNAGWDLTDECATLAVRMIRRVVSMISALLVCGPILASPPAAGPGSAAPVPTPSVVVLTAATLSMDDAVRMAEQRYHARVVKAETQLDNGKTVYVLRLLNESGRVWTVRVDASSGTVL